MSLVYRINSIKTKRKALFYSDPGYGKSYFFASYPRFFIIDLDGGLYGMETRDDINHSICRAEPKDYAGLKALYDNLNDNKTELQENFDYLVIDSLTKLTTIVEESIILRSQQNPKITQNVEFISDLDYGQGVSQTAERLKICINKFTELGINILILAHTDIKKSDKDPHVPYLPKRITRDIEGVFDTILYGYKNSQNVRYFQFNGGAESLAKHRSHKNSVDSVEALELNQENMHRFLMEEK